MSVAETLVSPLLRAAELVAVVVTASPTDTAMSSYTSTAAEVVFNPIAPPANTSTLSSALRSSVSIFNAALDATLALNVFANIDILSPEDTDTLFPATTDTSVDVTDVAKDAETSTFPAELRTAPTLPASDDIRRPTSDVVTSAVSPASMFMSAATVSNDVKASRATVPVVSVVPDPANTATSRSAFADVSSLVSTPTAPTPDTLTPEPADTLSALVDTPTVPLADTLTSWSANTEASVVRARMLVSESTSIWSVRTPVDTPAVRSRLVSAVTDAVADPTSMPPPLSTDVSPPTFSSALPLVAAAFPTADTSMVALESTLTLSVERLTPPPYESTARLPAVTPTGPVATVANESPLTCNSCAFTLILSPLYRSVKLLVIVMFGAAVSCDEVALAVASDVSISCNSPVAIFAFPPLEIDTSGSWPASDDSTSCVVCVSRRTLSGASTRAEVPASTVRAPKASKSKSADAFRKIPSCDVILTPSDESSSNVPVCNSACDASRSNADADNSTACPADSRISADADSVAPAPTISRSLLA